MYNVNIVLTHFNSHTLLSKCKLTILSLAQLLSISWTETGLESLTDSQNPKSDILKIYSSQMQIIWFHK